jgi:hypothetical protein
MSNWGNNEDFEVDFDMAFGDKKEKKEIKVEDKDDFEVDFDLAFGEKKVEVKVEEEKVEKKEENFTFSKELNIMDLLDSFNETEIDVLLKNNCKLEDLFDQDSLISEIKAQNKELMK